MKMVIVQCQNSVKEFCLHPCIGHRGPGSLGQRKGTATPTNQEKAVAETGHGTCP